MSSDRNIDLSDMSSSRKQGKGGARVLGPLNVPKERSLEADKSQTLLDRHTYDQMNLRDKINWVGGDITTVSFSKSAIWYHVCLLSLLQQTIFRLFFQKQFSTLSSGFVSV